MPELSEQEVALCLSDLVTSEANSVRRAGGRGAVDVPSIRQQILETYSFFLKAQLGTEDDSNSVS